MNVSLTDELKDFVRKRIESGAFPSEEAALQEAVRRFRRADQKGSHSGNAKDDTPEDFIDWEAIESCAREVEGKDIPWIEEVRQTLSKIPGSMGQAVIEDREDRF